MKTVKMDDWVVQEGHQAPDVAEEGPEVPEMAQVMNWKGFDVWGAINWTSRHLM
jgi:hypothetical protein